MKILLLSLITLAAAPALSAENRSPYDSNPACLDRNVDSSKGDCVIQDDGTPRRKYPPKTTSGTSAKPVTPAGQASPAREAAPAAGRKGG